MTTAYLVSQRDRIGLSGGLQKLCKPTTWMASASIRTKLSVEVTDKRFVSHWIRDLAWLAVVFRRSTVFIAGKLLALTMRSAAKASS